MSIMDCSGDFTQFNPINPVNLDVNKPQDGSNEEVTIAAPSEDLDFENVSIILFKILAKADIKKHYSILPIK